MTFIPITDPDDPRIAAFRDVRERDLAGREGVFLAEGDVVVRVLVSGRSRFEPVCVLASEGRARALGSWLRGVAGNLPVFVAAQSVMDRIAGFPIHRGLLALGRRRPDERAATLLPPLDRPALAVGLIGLANHDNVGSVFRNAAAFGADAVLLDGGSCDPLYRKAIRVSAGNALTVPFARGGSPDDLIGLLDGAGCEIVALSPSGRERLDRLAWPARSAILLGSEGHGLPESLLAGVRSVRIAMMPGIDSLNVAAAAAVALHAAHTGRLSRD